MQLMLAALLAGPSALAAGTAVWLDGAPDPTLSPDRQAVAIQQLVSASDWSEADERAVAHLADELAAVGPLKDEFDGELRIMRRLEAALASVDLVREQERDLVYRSLVFQGYAVHRYFQDALATDPAAETWRTELAQQTAITAWTRAIALDPDREPTLEELPDEPQLVAFKELRASLLLLDSAVIVADHLPADGRLIVDGRIAPAGQMAVASGDHDVALLDGSGIVARERLRLAPGETATLPFVAPLDDFAQLAATLSQADGPVLLDQALLARLASAQAPVELVAKGKKGPVRFEIAGTSAVPIPEATRTRASSKRSQAALVVTAGAGGAWTYDGNYLVQNLDQGAPQTSATVNAVGPLLHAAAGAVVGPVAVNVGIDASMPVGEHHDLPVGEDRMRARLFPHLSVGHPLLQLAVGPLLPWHVGLGPRLHLPLPDLAQGPLELMASYTHGIGLDLQDASTGAEFEPEAARMAWVGVGGRFRSGD